MPTVRRLSPHERDGALATVVAAFVADPLVRWWFPDDATYPDLASRFFGVLLDTRLEGGEVWTVEIDGTVAAVSMWVPPGGNLIGPDAACARYNDVVAELPAPSAERIAATDEVIDELLPTEPHWYLGVLATHPDHRHAGLGTLVCAPVFAAADRAGVAIALETAPSVNVAYYTRRGFAVLHEAELASDVSDDATDDTTDDTTDDRTDDRTDGAGDGATGVRPDVADDDAEPLTVRIMLRVPRADGVR